MSKYIVISGGVCSSLGKGVAAATIGALMEARGYSISMQKIDPYLNVDAGTMSPFQHGEVYVTDDGAETDLDLGNYSRFTHSPLSSLNSITTGKVYLKVIERERRGDYLGKTVQVIPHITNEIQNMIRALTEKDEPEIHIVEIGGTVGDIESVPFFEAVREFEMQNPEHILFIHLTLIPKIEVADEFKTKPTQHSVQLLRQIGIIPDIILTRISGSLTKDMRKKISLFCSIAEDDVFEAPDVENIYTLPLIYHKQGIDETICKKLGLKPQKCDLKKWEIIQEKIKEKKELVTIAVVGKYIKLSDAYKSVYEALKHAALYNDLNLKIMKVDSEDMENDQKLFENIKKKANGILVPGGFGARGIEGKIKAVEYARTNNIPFFGICLGMQCMTIEFARNIAGLEHANTLEIDERTPHPVINLMEDQYFIEEKGGTLRRGAYECLLSKGSKAEQIYKSSKISERHRHRYEFNNNYKDILAAKGLVFSGINEKKHLIEIIEWSNHPFGIGVQFHPEFKSKPFEPHPIFSEFIKASHIYGKK